MREGLGLEDPADNKEREKIYKLKTSNKQILHT